MDFQNEPELDQLFKAELEERVAALTEGAQAILDGTVTPDVAGRMSREGHTIKGTGRVMGHDAIAEGGETCELVWRWIQQGDLAPSSMLARTLIVLAEALPEALGGETEPVVGAVDMVRELIDDPDLVATLPSAETEPEEAPAVDDAEESPHEASDPVDEVRREHGALSDPDAGMDDEALPDADVGTADETLPVPIAEMDDEARSDEDAEAPHDDAESENHLVAAETEIEEVEDAAEGVPPVTEWSLDVSHSDDESEMDVAPLVFEPGPDGKLPTPVVTYEIVSSAFEDAGDGAVGDDAPQGPPQLSIVDEGPSVLDPEVAAAYDLGGLLGAVETWAAEESVPVNAGRLFRMINDVAAMRIDLDSAIRQAELLIGAADGLPPLEVEAAIDSLAAVRRASAHLESGALGLTMTPLTGVTSTLPQLARYLSKRLGKSIDLVVDGENTAVDRQMVDRVGEIVRHLVVNALAYGIEDEDTRLARGKSAHGTVRLSLSRDAEHLQIVVSDDGSGIDWPKVREIAYSRGLVDEDPSSEQLRSVLFSPGFSTDPHATEFTGEGEGLTRVTSIVEELFGTMTLESVPGKGTTFVITMPAHRALQRAQTFSAGGRSWGVPASAVLGILNLQDVAISVTEHGSTIGFDTETVPYASFAAVAGLDVDGLPSQVIVLQSPTGPIALAVDEVMESAEVATKDLSPLLAGGSVVSGVALLGGDETVMLVDAGRLADNLRELEVRPAGPVHTVLVVDDSQGVRQVVSGVLASHGFSTVSAGSVSDALSALARNEVDALVVDFSMPRADGVALIHMVRQRYGDIPVVMLSGVASPEDRARAERAGVHAFFDKSDFAKGALVEKLRELITEREAASKSEKEIAS